MRQRALSGLKRRTTLGAAALLGVLAASGHARGEPAAAEMTRLQLGLRTGFGLPLGKYADVRTLAGVRFEEVNALSDDIHGVIPLWLDAAYRLTQRLSVGAYFVYGLVLPKVAPAADPLGGGCAEAFDCSATGLRAGVQALYALTDGGAVRPWIGLAIGYEWVNTEIQGQDIDFRLETWHSGPEFLNLQGGADFRLARGFGLGPFVGISAMQYTSCSVELASREGPCELDERAWHGWAVFGVRGVLEL